MKIACCIFSYNITKGMKSTGPIGILKRTNKSNALINQQISYLRDIFKNIDFYIVAGFGNERLAKELPDKKYIHLILNNHYETKNYGYALKLLIERLENQINKYDGVFFLDSNVIIRTLQQKKIKKSWIVIKKKPSQKNKIDYLGTSFDNEHLDYLFYNIGDNVWCKGFYLTQKDMITLIQNQNFHDNMFIFEILNDLIENHNIVMYPHKLKSKNDCVEISGLKDKSKIK
tara:strand:+ start:134 stop:823 length:690 start_codon:yes stop_codon:yes gene_type:complete